MTTSGEDKSALQEARRALVAKYLALVIAGGLVVMALAALGASFISYASVSRAIVGSAPDPNHLPSGADTLARNFPAIVVRLRFCSAGLLLAALLATVGRRKIQIWIEEAVLALPQFLRGVAASLVRGLKADGKLNAWILLALSLLGVALRVRFLFQPIAFDEADNFVSNASRPLYLGLSWYPAPNNHLLNTLLMHFAWRLFGEEEWAIRLPALFAGCLLIPVTYWAARVLYNKHSALIATSMVTAASPLIDYSVNGRGYTMLCVLFLLLLITSQYLLEHDSPPAWLLWSLIAALGFYTIPIMLYAAGTAVLWLTLSSREMGSGRSRGPFLTSLGSALVLTAVLTALLYLPVLIVSGWKPLVSNSWVQPKGLSYLFANSPASVSWSWELWTEDVPHLLVWLLAAGFVTALVFHRRTAGYRVPVPLAAALCIPPLLLVQRVVPYARVWLFLIPLCAATSGAGLWFLLRRLGVRDETRASRLSAAIALSCLVLMCSPDLRGARFAARPPRLRVEQGVMWMKGRLMPRDVVVAKIPASARLSYYFRRHEIPLVSHAAPCDSMSVVYTSKGSLTANPGSGEMRVLAVATGEQTAETVLSTACLAGQTASVPRLVYEDPGMRVYEIYVGSGAHLSAPGRGTEK